VCEFLCTICHAKLLYMFTKGKQLRCAAQAEALAKPSRGESITGFLRSGCVSNRCAESSLGGG
jgi:hypothetical protein